MKKDMIGKKFNMLTVVKQENSKSKGKRYWLCKCDCGNLTVVNTSNLCSGQVKSCGCIANRPNNKSHGMSKTVLYSRWLGIKKRCKCEKTNSFENYGGKGVRVCKEWEESFESFMKWALANGFEEKLTIDRIDPNGDYCPENCRWITIKDQENNRSNNVYYEYNGECLTIPQLAEKYGINKRTLFWRINSKNMSIKEAIETPIDTSRNQSSAKKHAGLAEKCKKHGLRYQTVWQRMFLYGWSEEKALLTPTKRK